MIESLLEVRELRVDFQTPHRRVRAIRDLTFRVSEGETLAIIGDSGSGKSTCGRALMGLLPPATHVSGSVRFDGKEILGLPESKMRLCRGDDIAIAFQDSSRALNPTMRIGRQITEAVSVRKRLGMKVVQERALDLLRRLGFPAPRSVFSAFPHELSGGMRQRVMIAMAIARKPRLLIADEATSALDVVTRAKVMQLLMELQEQTDMALILISHDIELVASFAHTVLALKSGRTAEYAPTSRLISKPETAYTRALLEAAFRLNRPRPGPHDDRLASTATDPSQSDARRVLRCARYDTGARSKIPPFLEVENLVQEFRACSRVTARANIVSAVSGVSFRVWAGETLGIVGETGSGKTSLARALFQVPPPKSGSVVLDGRDLTQLSGNRLFECRRQMQMVFQEPFSSLNPKWYVRAIVREPLDGYRVGSRKWRATRAAEMLERVGLPAHVYGDSRPHELSGGECQRVAIARALVLNPGLIVFDEALASLDTVVRAALLELFQRLRAELKLTYLFISHDLAVVREISDRVLVLRSGQVCELAPTQSLYHYPLHPYVHDLVNASPTAKAADFSSERREEDRNALCGCAFYSSCAKARNRCALERPRLRPVHQDHWVACHYPLQRHTKPDTTSDSSDTTGPSLVA